MDGDTHELIPAHVVSLLDYCPIIPDTEGVRSVSTVAYPGTDKKPHPGTETICFVNSQNCCRYHSFYGNSSKYASCQNKFYTADLDCSFNNNIIKNIYYSPTEYTVARTWSDHKLRQQSNKKFRIEKIDTTSLDFSLSHEFASLTYLSSGRLSALITEPSLFTSCQARGEQELFVTGSRRKPPDDWDTATLVVESYSAHLRLSSNKSYAYILSGTVKHSRPETLALSKIHNSIQDMSAQPRLLSSIYSYTDMSSGKSVVTEEEIKYYYGEEHTKGYQPKYQLRDFGLPEPDPVVFIPQPPDQTVPAPPAPAGANALWLFALPPVGIFLILVGRGIRLQPTPPG